MANIKLCPIEQKILNVLKQYWNIPETKWLLGAIVVGIVIKKLALLLLVFVIIILLFYLLIQSQRKNVIMASLVLIFLIIIIFKPWSILVTPTFGLNLGIISISEPMVEEGNIAPLLYTLKKYIKYDPITKPKTAFLVIHPVSFQLVYNPKDDIYHGKYVLFMKNIGHSDARIKNIKWEIKTMWEKDQEMKLTSYEDYIQSVLKELDENKDLSIEQKKMKKNLYNFLIEELKCKRKILHPNDELIFSFSPQLQNGKNIKGIFDLSVEVEYQCPSNENIISKYNGQAEYNAENYLSKRVYSFKKITQQIEGY